MNTIRNILRLSGFLSLLLLLPASSFAQNVKVKIKAPEEVWENEEFRVIYSIEGSEEIEEKIKVDEFKNFEIIFGPSDSYSSSISTIGDKREATYTVNTSYILKASKKGKYTLPKAEVVIDGKKYKVSPASVIVKSLAKVEEGNEAFVRTIVSRTSVSPSDTLMLTYRLYTTMDIRQITKSDFPTTNDFYSNTITRMRQAFKQEEYNGKTYNVVDLRRMILQPRSIGLKTIPSGSVTIEFGIPTGKKIKDRWGDTYNEIIRKTEELPIEEVQIRVQQLIEI